MKKFKKLKKNSQKSRKNCKKLKLWYEKKVQLTLRPTGHGWKTAANSLRLRNSFIWATLNSTSCISAWMRWYSSWFSLFWLYKWPIQHEHSPWCNIWQWNGLFSTITTLRTNGVGTIFTNVLFKRKKKIHTELDVWDVIAERWTNSGKQTLVNCHVNNVMSSLIVVYVCAANFRVHPFDIWTSRCHCPQLRLLPFSMISWNWCVYPFWCVAQASLPCTAYRPMRHQSPPNSTDCPNDTSMHRALNSPTNLDYTLGNWNEILLTLFFLVIFNVFSLIEWKKEKNHRL